jgi:hypothetical protein
MKDSCAMTLFRRWGAFAGRVTLAIGIGAITPASAVATVYGASISNCPPPTPVVPIFPGSPTPVVFSGGNASEGGIVRAAATLSAETHAHAPSTGAFNLQRARCDASATANFDDVVIQGPPGPVTVRLHLPFHANFTQDWTEMTDGINQIHSEGHGEVSFFAQFGAAIARLTVNVDSDRQGSVRVTPLPNNNVEYVPKPRIPGLIPLDADGFVTLFFQRSLPVTGQVGQPFAGFDTYAIDELRGEIILTATVQANDHLPLFLNVSQSANAVAFFIMSGHSTIAQMRLSLPIDGSPVFELPEGYTAQVPSAGVINNVVPQVFKCTQTAASWRGHPGDWPLAFMPVGDQTYTQDELLRILQVQANALRPDASIVLAQQLIAARLNEANESAPGPMLLPSMTADTLLSGFGAKLPYRVNPATVAGQQMMNVAVLLNDYNAGRLTAACVP